jgi:hypothetical protein
MIRRETFHCLCGFTSDAPGTCPTCGDRLHSRGWAPIPNLRESNGFPDT